MSGPTEHLVQESCAGADLLQNFASFNLLFINCSVVERTRCEETCPRRWTQAALKRTNGSGLHLLLWVCSVRAMIDTTYSRPVASSVRRFVDVVRFSPVRS